MSPENGMLNLGMDLGGTSARAQLFQALDGFPHPCGNSVVTSTSRASNLTVLLRTLDRQLMQQQESARCCSSGSALTAAKQICIAAAGLFDGERIRHPQFPGGAFNVTQASSDLDIRMPIVLNDFAAEAAAASLGPTHVRGKHICGPEALNPDGNLHVVGPGTGLGHAFLLRRGARSWLQTTEAGHMAFPLRFPEEQLPLLRFVETKVRTNHPDGATVERVLSGDGLRLIIEFLTDQCLDAHAEIKLGELPVQVKDLFALHLGLQCASFLVGTSGKWDTLFLTGGVLKRNPDLLQGSGHEAFMRGLYSPKRHADDLHRVSVWLMQEPDTGTLGAAAIAMGHLADAVN